MYGIIAAGPTVRPNLMNAHRAVLRLIRDGNGEPVEFVVHTEGIEEGGFHKDFAHGHYFPVRGYKSARHAFDAAFERWQQKVRETCGDFDFDLFRMGEADHVSLPYEPTK